MNMFKCVNTSPVNHFCLNICTQTSENTSNNIRAGLEISVRPTRPDPGKNQAGPVNHGTYQSYTPGED